MAWQEDRPTISVGNIQGKVVIDGLLNESDWTRAPSTDKLVTIEPIQGGQPSGITEVKVIASEKELIIGVICIDPDPARIVSYSKLRDTDLRNEDHVRIVIDAFQDGQSGYIFAVNANGARYDALVSNRGESENKDWDAVWEAGVTRNIDGWSLEIKIPIQSIAFKKGLKEWGFNIERRIQRFQETIRWANARIDQWFIQTSRAGLITGLPDFTYGVGLNIRPSITAKVIKEANVKTDYSAKPSLDVSQRLGPNALATVTFNTDFAETEVDTKQTNLTRFPLFFPEKRAFFLEGADIFEFGLGLNREVIPFFSRRIGTYEGNQIPIVAGGKINGRFGNTAMGGIVMHTQDFENLDDSVFVDQSTTGVIRIKQNILKESSFGVIGTYGDPSGRYDNWMSGADFTYQTTSFRGNKNFLVGGWGLFAENETTIGDQSAFGVKLDYPNDLWDIALSYMRAGDGFKPALGFVPRNGVNFYRVGITYGPRPSWKWLRQMRNQFFSTLYTDLNGDWQSYRVFTAPINWRLESGDRVEVNANPTGEVLTEPFEIADSVTIPVGSYHFMRYRLEAQLAAKRKLNGQLTWWFGTFFNGNLDQLEASMNWNPLAILTFELGAVHNIGRLPEGNFKQTLVGFRVRLNVTPDLQINSFVQYDTDRDELGLNSRLHWIFHPQGDFFMVYNYNASTLNDNLNLINNQLQLKLRYSFRM